MIRLIVFLGMIAVLALGLSWIADQQGAVSLTWRDWRVETSIAILAFAILAAAILAIIVWSILAGLWHLPHRMNAARKQRRLAKGRAALADGLIAIGVGDGARALKLARQARKLAANDPLTLLLDAQAAQLAGDHDGARRAFHSMAAREQTRLLGLRGLFIEAQRMDDPLGALAAAEEAARLSPSSNWASQAVLGFRCAGGDWDGALNILENNHSAGLLNKVAYQRQRAVLLTAQAMDRVETDRDAARVAIMEAVRLAPSLVPAAVLASKFHAEDGSVRKAMRAAATAWKANPHPDLADAYIHVRLGDSARERLARAETLGAMMPDHAESALAIARAALEAGEFAKARAALAPLLSAPTQRVAMLMAEIERAEHGDSGASRQWTARAVRAALDPVWTADGYVSSRWRPVSPVTGRIDAFQWHAPVAALMGPNEAFVDSDLGARAGSAALALPELLPDANQPSIGPAAPLQADEVRGGAAKAESSAPELAPSKPPYAGPAPADLAAAIRAPGVQVAPGAMPADSARLRDAGGPAISTPLSAAPPALPSVAQPLFRTRNDLSGPKPALPPIIPITHAPDDPGIDGDFDPDAQTAPDQQPGGWRGAVSRWVG